MFFALQLLVAYLVHVISSVIESVHTFTRTILPVLFSPCRRRRGARAEQLHVPVELQRRFIQLSSYRPSRQRHGTVRHHHPGQPCWCLLRLPQVRGLPERDILRLRRRRSTPGTEWNRSQEICVLSAAELHQYQWNIPHRHSPQGSVTKSSFQSFSYSSLSSSFIRLHVTNIAY